MLLEDELPSSFIQDGEAPAGRVRRTHSRCFLRPRARWSVRTDPWSSWDGYADGSGFDTGTVVHYEAKHRPGRFVIAFPSELEYEPMSLSWGELLGETTCLSSSAEKAVLLPPRASSTLTLAPATRKVHRQPRTRTCLARNCCPMSLRIVIATFPA